MQTINCLFHRGDAGAQIHSFEAPCDLHEPLKILTADFGLAGV